jgi:hypothetical protein
MKLLLQIILVISIIALVSGDAPSTILSLFQISLLAAIGGIGAYGIMCIIWIPTRVPFIIWVARIGLVTLSASLTVAFVNQKNNTNAVNRLMHDPLLSTMLLDKAELQKQKNEVQILKNHYLNESIKLNNDGILFNDNDALLAKEEANNLQAEIKDLNTQIATLNIDIRDRKSLIKNDGSELDQALADGMMFMSIFWGNAPQAFSFFTICLAGIMISLSTSISFMLLPHAFPAIKNVNVIRQIEKMCVINTKKAAKPMKWQYVKGKVLGWRRKGVESVRNVESVGKLSNIKTVLPENCRDVPRKVSKTSKRARKVSIIKQIVIEDFNGNFDTIPADVEMCRIVRERFGIEIKRSTMNEYINHEVKPLLLSEGVYHENRI